MNTTSKTVTTVDQNVGWGNIVNLVAAQNANVGQVTVAHGLGTETVIRIRRLLTLKDSDNKVWNELCKETLKVLSFAWGNAFKGKSSSFKLYGNKFESDTIIGKISEDQKVDNILTHEICAEQIVNFCRAVN